MTTDALVASPSKRARSDARMQTPERPDGRVFAQDLVNLNQPLSAKRAQPRPEIASPTADQQRRVQWPTTSRTNVALYASVVATAEALEQLLATMPAEKARIFIAVAPWAADAWETCLGDDESRDALVRDAVVDAILVDVDAVPEATELLSISTSELPSAHSFYRAAGETAAAKKAQKVLHAPIDLTSLLCFEPIFGIAHLHRRAVFEREAGARDGMSTTFLVAYSGATWCPPCCRIMPRISTIVRELNGAVNGKGTKIAVVKVDRDVSGAIDVVYDVKLIPTFQVFNTADFAPEHGTHGDLVGLPLTAPDVHDEGDDAVPPSAEWLAAVAAARAAAVKPIAALQNSQAPTVQAFLERHCAPLTFDEEF